MESHPLRRALDVFSPLNLLAGSIYLFLLLPTLIVIPISLNGTGQVAFPPIQPSLGLYREFLLDPSWNAATLQSLKVALASLTLALCLGVPSAFALSRTRAHWLSWTDGLFVGPMLVPSVLIALGSYVLLSKLHLIGSTAGLVIAHTALIMPFVFITVKSGLAQLPVLTETAASVMGAGWLRIFFLITLPQLGKSIVSASLLAFLMSFDEVVISFFISSTQTTTLPVKMYNSIQWEVSPILAAVSTLLTIASIAICLLSSLWGTPQEDVR